MSKKNLILGGVLAALLLAAYLYEGPLADWQEKRMRAKNIINIPPVEQISRIELVSGGQQTAFDKVGDKWLVSGTKDFWLTDEQSSRIISALGELSSAQPDLVSSNQGNKAEFETDESGLSLTLKGADQVLESFVIGKSGPDFASSYISKPDQDETYLYAVALNSVFKNQEWLDRTIFSFPADQAEKLRFQYPNREFSLEKQENEWLGTLPYEFNVDQEKVVDIVSALAGLKAVEIPEQTFAGTGLEKNSIIVQISGPDFDHTIMVGDARETEEGAPAAYFAKRGDSDNIYLVSETAREQLNQTINGLR